MTFTPKQRIKAAWRCLKGDIPHVEASVQGLHYNCEVRVTDGGRFEVAQAISVETLSVHPGGSVMMTAGVDDVTLSLEGDA